MAHAVINQWYLLANASTEKEHAEKAIEFFRMMGESNLWLEIQSHGGEQITFSTTVLESVDEPFATVYIGNIAGQKPLIIRENNRLYQEINAVNIWHIAASKGIGILLVNDADDFVHFPPGTVKSLSELFLQIAESTQRILKEKIEPAKRLLNVFWTIIAFLLVWFYWYLRS